MVIDNFSAEKYISRLNKQMQRYIDKQYLLRPTNVHESILDPQKNICNYNDLLLENPLERDTKKYRFNLKKEEEKEV